MGEWRDEVWYWNLNWRRRLFVWEDELLSQMLELISHTILSFVDASWICTIGADGGYTVKDGYCCLYKNFLPAVSSFEGSGRVVKWVWESLAPMKVKIFSWQLLLQRLPTRGNLSQRGVIRNTPHSQCVWCHSELESEVHLFTKCEVAVEVWRAIHSWLGLTTAVPGNLALSFESFGFPFKCKKRKKGMNLIWQTVTWSLWIARNNFIFEGKKLKVYEIVDAIKHRSLDWFIASKFAGVCLLYEWEKFPLECLLR
jgi:hypothetical protein